VQEVEGREEEIDLGANKEETGDAEEDDERL